MGWPAVCPLAVLPWLRSHERNRRGSFAKPDCSARVVLTRSRICREVRVVLAGGAPPPWLALDQNAVLLSSRAFGAAVREGRATRLHELIAGERQTAGLTPLGVHHGTEGTGQEPLHRCPSVSGVA